MSAKSLITVTLVYFQIITPLLFQGCMPSSASQSDNYDTTPVREKGVAKNMTEIQALLAKLTSETEDWLSHRIDADGSKTPFTGWSDLRDEEEKNRYWLYKLMEAKEKIPRSNDKNGFGFRDGIWLDKINSDIHSIKENLGPAVKKFNAEFFRRNIGEDAVELQSRYVRSLQFAKFLYDSSESVNDTAIKKEIEGQITLLSSIDPDFKDTEGQVLITIVSSILGALGLNAAADESEVEEVLAVITKQLESLTEATENVARDALIAREIIDESSEIEVEDLVEELAELEEVGDLNEEELTSLDHLESLSQTTEEDMAVLILDLINDALTDTVLVSEPSASSVEFTDDREVFENVGNSIQLYSSLAIDINGLQAVFPRAMERMGAGAGAAVAGRVKFGLTALTGYQIKNLLFPVLVSMGIALYSIKEWKGAFSSYGDTMGTLSGMTFFFGHVRGLVGVTKEFLNSPIYKKMLHSSIKFMEKLPAAQQILGNVTAAVASPVNKVGQLISLMQKSFRHALYSVGAHVNISKGAIQAAGQLFLRLSPVATVAMIFSALYEIDRLRQGQDQGYKKVLTGVNIATTVTMGIVTAIATTGVLMGFFSIPGLNAFFLVGTVVWLFCNLLRSYGPEIGDHRPDDNDPLVQYFKNEIHPDHSYYAWCEDRKWGDNCSKTVYPDEFVYETITNEPIIRSNKYGSFGGKHALEPQEADLTDATITKVSIWRCNANQVGLLYKTTSRVGPIVNKEYHAGCGSEKGDRRQTTRTMEFDKDKKLVRIEAYISGYNLETRRVIGLTVCDSSDACISTLRQGEKNSVKFNNKVTFTNKSDLSQSVTGTHRDEGEIIGLRGRYGNSLDSIGVYLRMPSPTVYDPILYAETFEYNQKTWRWNHSMQGNTNTCLQYATLDGEQSSLESGRCKCSDYSILERPEDGGRTDFYGVCTADTSGT